MAKGIARKAFDWMLDRGAEKVYQDNVITDSLWKKAKSLLIPFLGGGSVGSILYGVAARWPIIVGGGVLGCVALIYITAVIRVWRMGRSSQALHPVDSSASSPESRSAVSADALVKTVDDCLSVGVFRSVIFDPIPNSEPFRPVVVTATVDFYGGGSASRPSPSELHLEIASTGRALCVLSALPSTVWECPGSVSYVGKFDANDLLPGILDTMFRERPQPLPNVYKNYGFVELRICLPGGQAGKDYQVSKTKIAFNLGGRTHQSFILRVKLGTSGLLEKVEAQI